MGFSESPWMGDPTFHSLGGKRGGSGQREEVLGKEGRLWAKRGSSGQRASRDGVGAGCSGERTAAPGSRDLGSPTWGWTRNFRTGGLQEPTDLMSGSSEAPICPITQLNWLPAIPEVDRATSYIPVIFILCWSAVAQQHCASFKGTDSTIHTHAYSFLNAFPVRVIT